MERCSLCPGKNRLVPPDGPENSPYLLCGEAAGANEDRSGIPFCGKTGQELNDHYLPLAGLRRRDVRITNAIKCLPVSTGGKIDLDSEKDRALLESCTQKHLYREIERQRPKLIIPMGAFATHAIDPAISLELQHGIPIRTRWGDTFPMYHPALGIHEPKKMLHIRTDFHKLRQYTLGKLRIAVDEYPHPDYAEVLDAREFRDLDRTKPLACDTESKRGGEPFCITYSDRAGYGRLIRATRRDLLAEFQKVLDRWEGKFLWHNWLYDSEVVPEMGLYFPHHKIIDTMTEAFRLGNLPQGLKALSYRELGMEMEDFDDVVRPYSSTLVVEYYRALQEVEWPKPEPSLVIDKDGNYKLYKPHSMSTKLKTFFTYLGKNPDKDVFEAWDNWDAEHAMIESVAGKWPGKCISHVPFDKVLWYSCRDADSTWRLWPLLQHMIRRVRKTVQERWIDGYNGCQREPQLLSAVGGR